MLTILIAIFLGFISPQPAILATSMDSVSQISIVKQLSSEEVRVEPKLDSPEPIWQVSDSLRVPNDAVVSTSLTQPVIYYQITIEDPMPKKVAPAQVEPEVTPEPITEAPKSAPTPFEVKIEPIAYPEGYTLPNDGTGPSGTKVLAFKTNEALASPEITVEIHTEVTGLSFSNIMLDGTKLEEVSPMLYRLPTGSVVNAGDVYLAGLADAGPYTAEITVKSLNQTCGNCTYPSLPVVNSILLQP